MTQRREDLPTVRSERIRCELAALAERAQARPLTQEERITRTHLSYQLELEITKPLYFSPRIESATLTETSAT